MLSFEKSMPALTPTAPRVLFFALLAAFCLWTLHLPMFPMQDGPMHLYLASVLGDLLTHRPFYTAFYQVQHLLPPYSLHYYLLIALMRVVPALWAEKIVICLILICFSTGVRALALANGRAGNFFGLFSLAIALNWPLMMGFQNYILSLGFACWALAAFASSTETNHWRHRARFLGLCWLGAITHPLPLLLILAFAAADLTFRAVLARPINKGWTNDAAIFAIAATLLLYLRAFTDKRRSVQDLHPPGSPLTRAHYFLGLHGLDFFNRAGLAAHLIQLALYLILAITLTSAAVVFSQRKKSEWRTAHTWLIVTLLFTAALPFLPDDLSGSKAVVSRLQIVTFIGLIAAASGLPRLSQKFAAALAAFAALAALGTLALAQLRLAPIARRIAAVDTLPLPRAGDRGLLLSAGPDDASTFAAVTYEPLHWQAAAYFRQSGAALLNTPWMDSTWLPLAAKPTLLTAGFVPQATPWTLECYSCLRRLLVASAAARAQVFPRTDFIVFVNQPGAAQPAALTQSQINAFLQIDSADHWSCSPHDWLWLCQKSTAKSTHLTPVQ